VYQFKNSINNNKNNNINIKIATVTATAAAAATTASIPKTKEKPFNPVIQFLFTELC